MKRLVFLSLEFWDDIWRRNQFICRELIGRHPDLEILWLNPPLDVSPLSPNGKAWLSNQYALHPAPGIDRLHIFQPFKLFPNVIAEGVNQYRFKKALRAVLAQMGWTTFKLWINNESLCGLATVPGVKGIIYDITDDWSQASLSIRQRHRVRRDDAWLCEHADCVIVCSEHLQNLKAGSKAPVRLIPNGVDYTVYSPESLARLVPPAEVAGLDGPVAGYTGTLHEDRFDVDLISWVMQKLPAVQFLFVGPDYLEAGGRQRMLAQSNCHVIGAKPYDSLPSYMSVMDVLITPHKVNSFTDSLNPLKLYEYMATGKPIVSAACAGFRDLPTMISVANSAEEFATKLESAAQHPQVNLDRIAWASQFGWDRRAAEIESVLDW